MTEAYSEIFKSGELVLPQTGPTLENVAVLWRDCLVNRILTVAAVIILLVCLTETLRLLPSVIYCIKMSRGAVNLEHSLSQARSRNIIALIHILPFCLIIDSLGLYHPSFVPEGLGIPVILGALLGYLLLRLIMFKMCMPGTMSRRENSVAAHRAPFTFFIALVILLLLTLGVLTLFHSEPGTIRTVALYEIYAIYGLSVIRTAQILGLEHSGVTTFLYLCALEFAPAGLIVFSALYL